MTLDKINKLSRDELLDVMRREELPLEHSMFATTHHRSDERADGFTESDLDEIGDVLEDGDLDYRRACRRRGDYSRGSEEQGYRRGTRCLPWIIGGFERASDKCRPEAVDVGTGPRILNLTRDSKGNTVFDEVAL
ncbi:MAG: hypothetical protein M0D54_21000 [Hyphomonadaceae bacterium JAD_PAG50586_4]|nr:MAG: hypothetical protein M0D54_21000 [Hyphomonadaceae bacterium JAD_PAG50586_4]